MKLLIAFRYKLENYPDLISQHIIKKEKWEEIKNFFDKSFLIKITDYDVFSSSIIINNENLTIDINENYQKIQAFSNLYGNYYGNYDLLKIFENEVNNILSKDENQIQNKIDFFIEQKNKTPEFCFLEDDKIVNMINETTKGINDFTKKLSKKN